MHIQNNVPTIPSSWNVERIEENFKSDDFVLEKSDVDLLWSINKNQKCSWDPTTIP